VRIVVAMSGGVDSSVAAALLAEQGHDLVGVSMQLFDQRHGTGESFGRCCSLDDLQDARRVAASVGIPHYVLNLEARFAETVVADFVAEYAAGRTPIPCTHCNSDLKFETLVERAAAFDADAVATGHYAQLRTDTATGRCRLFRGRDRDKDQSYFLFSLTQRQLARASFPVGEMSKAEVRAVARRKQLPVADKPDSQEICFVPDGNYADFVERRLAGADGGSITDASGRVLGRHDGIHRYTVGQRKGLRLSSTEPLYVLEIRAAEQTVMVGPRAALERTSCRVARVNWVAGAAPGSPVRLTVQIRHRHEAAAATVTPLAAASAAVEFDEPQRAIAPGQAAVFYEGDEVIGGGWIGSPSPAP
jgi:tRNA-uridine 2-sulfurtransferase